MQKKEFLLTVGHALNSRAATLLVRKANQFKCKTTVEYDNTFVDLKSIMGVLSLAVPANSNIVIICDGDDELSAIDAITLAINEINSL